MIVFWPGLAGGQSLPPLTVSGDLRIRLEEDWDARTAAGTQQPDRGRARLRARIGAAADLGDGFRLEGRLRTGTAGSQQNANITVADFSGNAVDKLDVTAERYSLSWTRGPATLEAGKMGFPFFTPNEYLWDADISPRGAAATFTPSIGGGAKVRLVAGAFALPVGLTRYAGSLYAGQAYGEAGHGSLAVGLFGFQADRSDPARVILLDGNGSRNYSILAVNGSYRARIGSKHVTVTVDLFRNLQGYASDPDPISRAARNQRTGFVAGIATGDVSAAGHLQLGYRWFRMEKLAVNASYAQDDLSRLGIPSQAANTDLTGHDFYANYQVAKHWTIGARVMLSHRIRDVEGDKRARTDLTYTF